jgi:hypothetical protein
VVAVEVLLLEEKEVLHKNQEGGGFRSDRNSAPREVVSAEEVLLEKVALAEVLLRGEGSSDRAPRRSESFW